MIEPACGHCKYRLNIRKYDYSGKGCRHEDVDGFVCLALAYEKEAMWLVGVDPAIGKCECYKEDRTDDSTRA